MKRRCLGLLVLCFGSALAEEPSIHLRSGVYVEKSTPCKSAPFAAIKTWDGIGFGGAHSSRCLARVIRTEGSTFAIEDTCNALGDGTPAKPYTEAATVTVTGTRSFRYVRTGVDTADYRWCARK